MPQNVRVRLNVGGTVFHTSLHTVLEGARRGSSVFQCLSAQILGPPANDATVGSDASDGSSSGLAWEQRVVPAQKEQYRFEHFVDADPAPFPIWLEYLRTGEVPSVDVGPERKRIICNTERAGLVELATALRGMQEEETDLDRVKRELQDVREKLQAQELKHDAVLGTLEDMRKHLDEIRSEQSKQASNRKIVSYCVAGTFGSYGGKEETNKFSERCSQRVSEGWEPYGGISLSQACEGSGIIKCGWCQACVKYAATT